jgi:UDP-3-O-[3-hydroxymyristoyl] glucosamine N-acyltransferase
MIYIHEILKKITFTKFIGNELGYILQPISFDSENKDPHVLMWVSDKNIDKLKEVISGTIICSSLFNAFHKDCNYIVTANPRLTFQKILSQFFVQEENAYISETATIHPTVKIGNGVTIGHNVVIERDCVIGSSVQIDHNTVLKHGTEIHDNVKIGANCTIGGVGFGYELDEEKKYVLLPHLGNVVLKSFVEIGNNTCIDRAVMGSTILEENVKVDNLVHIAHGVVIGKNSLIIANSMIAGSTKIGENVWVAPSVSILNKKTISNNSYIGMGAVVIKDVKENETIVGNPGKALVKSENKA